MIKCRVMKLDVFWADAFFHFPMEITGEMVKETPKTRNLNKNDMIGTFDFDEKYLESFETETIRGIKYYFIYNPKTKE